MIQLQRPQEWICIQCRQSGTLGQCWQALLHSVKLERHGQVGRLSLATSVLFYLNMIIASSSIAITWSVASLYTPMAFSLLCLVQTLYQSYKMCWENIWSDFFFPTLLFLFPLLHSCLVYSFFPLCAPVWMRLDHISGPQCLSMAQFFGYGQINVPCFRKLNT